MFGWFLGGVIHTNFVLDIFSDRLMRAWCHLVLEDRGRPTTVSSEPLDDVP